MTDTTATITDQGEDHSVEEDHHPTTRQYWLLALLLAVITAVEIAIPELTDGPIKVPALLILAAVKFAIVVAFFMHLKFDKPIFRMLFLVGVFGSVPIFVVVLLTFRAL